jgi:hypothetical protein
MATRFPVLGFNTGLRMPMVSRSKSATNLSSLPIATGSCFFPLTHEYTSGTLYLRSHVRFHIEAGARLFASREEKDFDRKEPNHSALLYGDNLENVTIEGRGTVDGQAEYEWRLDDHERGFGHKRQMLSLGKPILRTFPKGFPARTLYPFLIWLVRSKDIQINGLSLLHSPSWSIAQYACERVVIDGVYIYTSLKEAVWADGIDLDGCAIRMRVGPGSDERTRCSPSRIDHVWTPGVRCLAAKHSRAQGLEIWPRSGLMRARAVRATSPLAPASLQVSQLSEETMVSS